MATETTTQQRTIAATPDEARRMLSGGEVTVRRKVEPQPYRDANGYLCWPRHGLMVACPADREAHWLNEAVRLSQQPEFDPGDVLAVLESWKSEGAYPDKGQPHIAYETGGRDHFDYIEDWGRYMHVDAEWQPADTMPAWASRLSLRLTAVTVERDAEGWWWKLVGRAETKGTSR